MKLAPLALALTLTTSALAQATFTDPANLRGERVRARDGRELPVDQGASGLQQLLRRLNTRASILNIVAHPDDEDGGMLTLYSRGIGARVADLSLTRGEGGQNAMTGDFEDALGLLRTQELLANDRYVGVEQMFGTEVDFGFSKTKEEAFAKWTHDRVLYDAVRAIRIFRPLVITATFIGGVTDGHGQHQVSGQIAQQAFKAAGDPKVFPELTAEGILPWQPLKMYARVPMQSISPKGLYDYATGQYIPAKFTNYVTGEVTTTPPSVDVVVHEGTPDPLLGGKSYVQFARIGLGLQKSQIGPGFRNAPAGAFDVSYHLYGSKLPPANTNPQASSKPQASSNSQAPTNSQASSGSQAPTARSIPVQGNALGGQKQKDARVEGPAYNPAPNFDPAFFAGIDTSIEGIGTLTAFPFPPLQSMLQNLSAEIRSAMITFDPKNPSATAPALADALRTADATLSLVEKSQLGSDEKASVLHELRIKRVQLNDALALSLDLSVDATAQGADQVLSKPLSVTLNLHHRPGEAIRVLSWKLASASSVKSSSTRGPLKSTPHTANILETATITFPASSEALVTRPYFFRDNIEVPVYQLQQPNLRNAAQTPAALTAWALVNYRGLNVELARIVHYGAQPVRFVPEGNISLLNHAQVLSATQKSFPLTVLGASLSAESNTLVEPYRITIQTPPGWSAKERQTFPHGTFEISVPAMWIAPVTLRAEAISVDTGKSFAEGYRPIGYGDLPRTNFFTPATDRIVPVDLKLPTRNRIAYLPGTGDDVPSALASIGLTPTILTVADLTSSNLARYDTVILGVRTYNAHPDLHGPPTQALLDYARNGGNVVVQYQTYEFTAADAPYPLTLGSNEKVVDETAAVELLTPNHAAPWTLGPGPWTLLSTPNRITSADFNNWVEERGHGFLGTWDSHYTALTETHDPGGPETAPQLPQRGGLITTPLGKGRWTYCAFALYRQLPEAVPGAFRLFVNLLHP